MLKTIRKHGITLALFAAGSTGLTAAINQMTKTTIAEQAHLLVFLSDSKNILLFKRFINKSLKKFQGVFMWKKLEEEEILQVLQMNPQFIMCDFK